MNYCTLIMCPIFYCMWRLWNHSTQPKVFKLVDKDHSGGIDFNQFASLIGTAASICLVQFYTSFGMLSFVDISQLKALCRMGK